MQEGEDALLVGQGAGGPGTEPVGAPRPLCAPRVPVPGWRVAEPAAGTPGPDGHTAQAVAIETLHVSAHHLDDLLHGRRIGWIAKAFIAWRNTSVKA